VSSFFRGNGRLRMSDSGPGSYFGFIDILKGFLAGIEKDDGS